MFAGFQFNVIEYIQWSEKPKLIQQKPLVQIDINENAILKIIK